MEKKELNFEEKLNKLDEILKTLEAKTLPLDESLKLYESGVNLLKELEKELKDSEEKLENIIQID